MGCQLKIYVFILNLLYQTQTMSPKTLFCSIICLLLVLRASSFNYLLISDLRDVNFYRCLKQAGVNEVGIIVQSDLNGIQKEFLQNVANAKSAGMAVQVVFTLCREKPELQIQEITKYLGPKVVDKFWVSPFNDNVQACKWISLPGQANCEYFNTFLNLLKGQGIKTEVITTVDAWIDAFKNRLGCTIVNNNQLWYVPGNSEQDWQPNFNSYKQIGGWQKPYMKLYSEQEQCGSAVLINYYQ